MELVFFAGGSLTDQNKGCQALGFGGIEFIKKRKECKIIIPTFTKKRRRDYNAIDLFPNLQGVLGKGYSYFDIIISIIELNVLRKTTPHNKLAKDLVRSDVIYNVSGGDSFSDIYGIKQFIIFMLPSFVALIFNKKHVLLPQTIGPFKRKKVENIAKYILRKSNMVFVRDTEFVGVLKKWEISYKEELDLSSFMQPQKVDKYEIQNDAIGINISGLTYFNNYKGLSGHFDCYQKLCADIISHFQKQNKAIWLVPHTYLENNTRGFDDLNAIYDLYKKLPSTKGVYLIDKDHNGMELKYIISQFSFFIGTRMHSCFASIFSNVPTFGLAYSYKFKGSFDKMDMTESYYDINYLKAEEINEVVSIIKNRVNKIEKKSL